MIIDFLVTGTAHCYFLEEFILYVTTYNVFTYIFALIAEVTKNENDFTQSRHQRSSKFWMA